MDILISIGEYQSYVNHIFKQSNALIFTKTFEEFHALLIDSRALSTCLVRLLTKEKQFGRLGQVVGRSHDFHEIIRSRNNAMLFLVFMIGTINLWFNLCWACLYFYLFILFEEVRHHDQLSPFLFVVGQISFPKEQAVEPFFLW